MIDSPVTSRTCSRRGHVTTRGKYIAEVQSTVAAAITALKLARACHASAGTVLPCITTLPHITTTNGKTTIVPMQNASDEAVSDAHDRTTRDRGGGGTLMTSGRTVFCTGAVPSAAAGVPSLMRVNVARTPPARD